MSNTPIFVYAGRPLEDTRVNGLFDNGSVRQLLEQPGGLRHAGWDLQTLGQARIVRGQYLEVVLADQKTIRLYEDGMLLAKVPADRDFLAWGSSNDLPFEDRPRLNPLSLIEFSYNFVWLYQRLVEHDAPKPKQHTVRVSIRNTTVGSKRLYLNPYGIMAMARLHDSIQYPAPDENGDVAVRIDAETLNAPARAAYLLIEKIYLWFGVPTTEIPYVTGQGTERSLDLKAIQQGGKE